MERPKNLYSCKTISGRTKKSEGYALQTIQGPLLLSSPCSHLKNTDLFQCKKVPCKKVTAVMHIWGTFFELCNPTFLQCFNLIRCPYWDEIYFTIWLVAARFHSFINLRDQYTCCPSPPLAVRLMHLVPGYKKVFSGCLSSYLVAIEKLLPPWSLQALPLSCLRILKASIAKSEVLSKYEKVLAWLSCRIEADDPSKFFFVAALQRGNRKLNVTNFSMEAFSATAAAWVSFFVPWNGPGCVILPLTLLTLSKLSDAADNTRKWETTHQFSNSHWQPPLTNLASAVADLTVEILLHITFKIYFSNK